MLSLENRLDIPILKAMAFKNYIVTCFLDDPDRMAYPIETTLAALGPVARFGTAAWWVQTDKPARSIRHALVMDPGPFRHLGGPEDDFYLIDLTENSVDSWHDGRNLLPAIASDWQRVFETPADLPNVVPLKPKT